jgi:hypothetical protein
MKAFIKKFIKKCFQKAGIHIQRLPEAAELHSSLKNKPVDVRNHELKRITHSLGMAENHTLYDEILRAFVPAWMADIKEAAFTGSGISGSSLNTYRRVTIGGKHYFEKVYFNSRPDLQTVQWFEEHIYDLIKDEINVPTIRKKYRGELLTIVYYDFLELAKLEKETKESRLIQFSKDLCRLSYTHETYLTKLDPPETIRNFRNNNTYQKHIHLAGPILSKCGIDIRLFEKAIGHSTCVLTHSDINEGNGFKDAILIDWDHFGIYPIGLEPAYIYYRIILRDIEVDNAGPWHWLKMHYKPVIKEEDWKTFERNFTYFLFVFSIKMFNIEEYKSIEDLLIERLKQYNCAKFSC